MTCLVIQVLVVVADGLTETQRLPVEVTYTQREQQNHELRSPNLAMKNIAKDFWIDGWNCASSDYVHWSYNQVPKWEVLGSRVHRDELVLLLLVILDPLQVQATQKWKPKQYRPTTGDRQCKQLANKSLLCGVWIYLFRYVGGETIN